MTITPQQAARRLCEAAEWSLPPFLVQNGLYICHMVHLGEKCGPLLNEKFESWDHGPVLPSLHRDLEIFDDKPVTNIYWLQSASMEGDTQEAWSLDLFGQQLKDLNTAPDALTKFVCLPDGAWARHHRPGMKGFVISYEDIVQEYNLRSKRGPSKHPAIQMISVPVMRESGDRES